MTRLGRLAETLGPSIAGLGRGARQGSGFVVAPDRVLTLAHQLRGEEVEVAVGGHRGRRGRLLGADAALNLALLDVPTVDVSPVTWADGPALTLGDRVIALADPGGTGLRVTTGTVAAAPARLPARRGRPIEGVIEHTAPMPRGSGGGPLVDRDGRVVGINALREAGGLVLALPAAEVRPRLEALLAGRPTAPRQLGVAVVGPRAARRMRRAVGLPERDGLLVQGVADDSAAATAAIARGDLLLAVDGHDLAAVDDLYAALDGAPLGKPVPVRLLRGAEELEVVLTLPKEPKP